MLLLPMTYVMGRQTQEHQHTTRDLAMEFEPIKKKRTTEIVTEKLEEKILDGTFSDGDKLPSEEELANQFGVGRRSIREALKVLEAKGLVEIHMGIGAIVQRNDLDNFLNALARNMEVYLRINRADLKHVMELRRLLEGAAMEKLIERRSPEKMDQLAVAVKNQRTAFENKDYATYQEWHFSFHSDIINYLENPLISMIYRQVLTLMRDPMEKSGSKPEVSTRAIKDHENMISAIERKSITDVEKLLDEHLTNFIYDLTESIE